MQIADDNANSSLLINGTELGDGVNEVETVQYFLYKLGQAGLLMGDDIKTGTSTGADYWAALRWLRENQNKRP